MAENKYDNLFISGVDPEIQARRPYATIGFLDGKTFEGCNEYQIFWVGPKPYGAYGTKAWGEIYHGPHTHKYPELFIHLGTDPENPFDLGAEVEMFVGPEMEKHIVTTSTLVYIPANFVHCPFTITKVDRPFLFIQAQYAPKLTETSYKKLIAEAERDKYIFLDADGTQKD